MVNSITKSQKIKPKEKRQAQPKFSLFNILTSPNPYKPVLNCITAVFPISTNRLFNIGSEPSWVLTGGEGYKGKALKLSGLEGDRRIHEASMHNSFFTIFRIESQVFCATFDAVTFDNRI